MYDTMLRPLRVIDNLLNRITMYKLMAWGLIAVLICVIAAFSINGNAGNGIIWILVSPVMLAAVCFASNWLFAKLFKVAANSESWLITAMILTFIMPTADSLLRGIAIAAVGIIAMAVKYVLVWRGAHFLNPAAAAALVGSLTGLLPATWWIANPTAFPFVAVLGLLVLRKTRRFELFFAFAIAALGMLLLFGQVNGIPLTKTLREAVVSWPLVFLGTIMLTEPSTQPAGRQNLWLYGALVGALFGSQLKLGFIIMTPHLSLLIGNVVASLVLTPKRGLQLSLVRQNRLGPSLYEFSFKHTGKPFAFSPGQYLEWTLPHKGADVRGNRRTFSIASSPTEPELLLGTKTYEPSSSFKKALLALQPGGSIQAGHIGGDFTLPSEPGDKLLFIAGGIGITPFRSMLKYLVDSKQKCDVVLIYAVKDRQEAVYQDVLDEAKAIGLKTVVITELLSADILKRDVPDAAERLAYISGPHVMVEHARSLLREQGARTSRIKTDFFSGY